jgi:predicted unusual protein kinase regulating ubiquinone biosynthesis (AarF/ABC1/UbiB family)
MADDALRRLDALLQVGLRLARSAPSGRVLLARIADAIELEWIPRPWGDPVLAELERAHAAAREPLPLRRVERVLREAWGAPVSEELDELSGEPVAVTAGAQVHRGVVDGRPVAVKVLRPGLAASVRQDLALLEAMLAPLGAAFPALDARAVVAEFRERILEELDLESEAVVQRRFHRALRGHPFLTVPAPVMRLSHESVLVSEWVDGVPLRDAPDRDEACARLVLFAMGAAREGVIHADPDPDDVLVLADGRLAILDFGATRAVDVGRLDLACGALDALAAGDADGFGEALAELGALPAELGPAAMELATYALGELIGGDPSRLDSAAVVEARDRALSRPDVLVRLALSGTLAPEDLWPARGAAQLFGTIARVGATGPWRELARSALRDGWKAPVG